LFYRKGYLCACGGGDISLISCYNITMDAKEEFTLEEDLDFEISFYEDLVRDKSDFIDALMLLADAYTKKGLYEKGLEADLKLTALRPKDPTIAYNLACDYSLLKDADRCLETLEKAIALGYRDFRYMTKDPDLDFIRHDNRYKALILRFRKR
jgi:tetratricopeptide (TPR) repeat protein